MSTRNSVSGNGTSRAGVLITGYGSPDQIIEGVTFRGFTVKNAGLNPPITATGTHAGASHATILTDPGASFPTPDGLVGQWVHNYGDKDPADWNPARSYGQITANTATTVTVVSLSGGKENDWDTDDPYLITPYEQFHNTVWIHYPNYDGLRGIAIGNGKDILIQNCKVTHCGMGGISSGYARLVSTHKYSEGITVDNCIVTDHFTTGIGIGENVGTCTVTNNLVERNRRPSYEDATRENAGHGIQVSGSKNYGMASGLIANNIVKDNGFEGIILAKYTDGVIVEDNTVTGHKLDQDGAGIFAYGDKSNPANCKNNIIRNNTVTGNIRGIVAYYAQYCTIQGNTITTDSGAFALGQGGIKLDGANNILVQNNILSSLAGIGIKVQNTWNGVESFDNTIMGNTITGAQFAGIPIWGGAHDNTFTGNTITGTTELTFWAGSSWEETQADGVFIDDDAGIGNVFHNNTICGNADEGMENQTATTVDAENNWWGDASGPYHPTTNSVGIGDPVSDYVDYRPWDEIASYSCLGFGPPMDKGAVTVKKNRVLPLKAELLSGCGYLVTDIDIIAPPVIQVVFEAGTTEAEDVTDDALSAGKGTEGNEFVFTGSGWQFNLKTKNYSAPGTYTVTMVSGDNNEYVIESTCEAQFVIE